MANPGGRDDPTRKCPRCGKGDLVDITYRGGPTAEVPDDDLQAPESHQVETYSCGHEVVGPRLDRTAAGSEDLEAERRTSEDTTDRMDI